MASKPHQVLLGFVDEQITSRNQQMANFSISKIGGIPDWCISGCEIPICKRCGRRQSLVVQVYSPLEGAVHHRTLYVFACVTQECWNRQHSWTCLRSQVLDLAAVRTSVPPSKCPPSVSSYGGESWFQDEHDWGGNDNDGNGNADNYNLASSSQLYLDNMAKTGGGRSNLNNMNSNTTSITEVAQKMESKLNIIEDDANANEAVCGAVGIVGCEGEGVEATAVIEGPEGDMIAVDTPEQPTTDIPALFQEAAQIDANADVTFSPFFMVSDVEPPEDVAFSEHERELLLRYTHTTGHDFREEEIAAGADGKGDGVYEKDIAIHGDVLLHKFKKRISRSPQQILRYCREEGASPLWLRPPGASDVATKCPCCGGSMVFEMQITPQLVLHLRVPGVQGTPLEFGSVAVFTCSASCWNEKDIVKQEAIVVQCEVI
ncbi:programmed cell death protein 2-like [Homarus americanus]|uniref:programmed cell death protein 2-like n=1 Tax=Homarus americanus TaxID=6706 RepID=UPI001C47C112|nr:programmed cell death protein 2-like [Homarus americanus]